MEEKIRQGDLFDFYGDLLNEHQRRIYADYVINDFSLAEIAEEEGTSRQAVHDIIRRCTKTLERYEETLGLHARFLQVKQRVDEIRRTAEALSSGSIEAGDAAVFIRQTAEQLLEDVI